MKMPLMTEVFKSLPPEEAIIDLPDNPLVLDLDQNEFESFVHELQNNGWTMGSDDVLYHPKHWRPLDPKSAQDKLAGQHLNFGERTSDKIWYAGHGQAYLALTPQARAYSLENPPAESLSIDLSDPEAARQFFGKMGPHYANKKSDT